MRPLLLFLSVFIASISLGADGYLPLAKGQEWIMDVTITAPNGEVSKATGRRKTGDTEERNGKTYHRSLTAIEDGPAPMSYTRLIRKDETAFYTLDPRDKAAQEQPEVLLPLTVGKSWQRMIGPLAVTDKVVALEAVTVNGKTYEKCFHIRTTSPGGEYTEDYWEAPDVGNVKSEIVYGNGVKLTLTLREFKDGK